MTDIEQLRRTLGHTPMPKSGGLTLLGGFGIDDVDCLVRAVVRAMREPSTAMLEAAQLATIEKVYDHGSKATQAEWEAMIDSLLTT